MPCALEQLKARPVDQVEISHAFLARYDQVEVFLAGHDERRHLYALAVGLGVQPANSGLESTPGSTREHDDCAWQHSAAR